VRGAKKGRDVRGGVRERGSNMGKGGGDTCLGVQHGPC